VIERRELAMRRQAVRIDREVGIRERRLEYLAEVLAVAGRPVDVEPRRAIVGGLEERPAQRVIVMDMREQQEEPRGASLVRETGAHPDDAGAAVERDAEPIGLHLDARSVAAEVEDGRPRHWERAANAVE